MPQLTETLVCANAGVLHSGDNGSILDKNNDDSGGELTHDTEMEGEEGEDDDDDDEDVARPLDLNVVWMRETNPRNIKKAFRGR